MRVSIFKLIVFVLLLALVVPATLTRADASAWSVPDIGQIDQFETITPLATLAADATAEPVIDPVLPEASVIDESDTDYLLEQARLNRDAALYLILGVAIVAGCVVFLVFAYMLYRSSPEHAGRAIEALANLAVDAAKSAVESRMKSAATNGVDWDDPIWKAIYESVSSLKFPPAQDPPPAETPAPESAG